MRIEHLVFLLEEPSAQDFLLGLLPRVIPAHVAVHFLVFEGKQDLEKQLMRRLRAWLRPNSCFVVMRDQDSGDCLVIKARLRNLCEQCGRPDTVIRIACRELETFFVGDWAAIADAFGQPSLARHDRQAKFRQPDHLGSPYQELRRAIPQYQKRAGARRIAPLMAPERNRSRSFQALFGALQNIARQT